MPFYFLKKAERPFENSRCKSSINTKFLTYISLNMRFLSTYPYLFYHFLLPMETESKKKKAIGLAF